MANNIKQVYASLFIDENELQILAGEYYNTRFNVIRCDKFVMEGIIDFRINDENKVVEIIKKAIEHTSQKIGATIKKVILVLPSFNFSRHSLRVSVVPNGGILTKKEIAKAVSSALRSEIDASSLAVNASINKYFINGLAQRRMPEKEICDEAIIDIDLLCAEKQLVYDYVSVVSKAGVEVADITLNSFAIAKEAVLLEQSLNQNIILMDIGYEHTYLSLLSKGKLVSSEIVLEGLSRMIDKVNTDLKIPRENIARILKYNVDFDSKHGNDAVFAWGDDKENYSITIDELSTCVKQPLQEYIEKIMAMCKPIMEADKTSFFVCGEGSKMNALIDCLQKTSQLEVKSYYPDTVGVRDASLCAIYGSLFVYREKALLNDLNVSCLDMSEYDQTVDLKKVDVEGESITSKIKKLFEIYRDDKEDYNDK